MAKYKISTDPNDQITIIDENGVRRVLRRVIALEPIVVKFGSRDNTYNGAFNYNPYTYGPCPVDYCDNCEEFTLVMTRHKFLATHTLGTLQKFITGRWCMETQKFLAAHKFLTTH